MKKIEFKDMYTPLSADTFNTLQNNFENEIKKLERKYKMTIALDIVIGIFLLAIIVYFLK